MSSILEFRYFDNANTSIVANYVADIYTAAGVILAGATGVAITELAPGRYRVTNAGTETGHHTLHVRASSDNSLLTPPLDYTLRNDATAHWPEDPATIIAIAGTGSGARTITVTVNDGAAALQNARVRFTEGVNSFSALTNASGQRTFNLDDATYTVAITKDGYTFAGTTLVVTAAATPTYSMTAVVITPAATPTQSTLSMTCFDENLAVEPGAIVTLQMIVVPTSDTGRSYDAKPITLTADANGLIEVAVARLAQYKRTRGTGLSDIITIPDAATCTFSSFFGREA